jgi:hypothetical protein
LPSKSLRDELADRAFARRHETRNDQLGSHARFAIRVDPFDSPILAGVALKFSAPSRRRKSLSRASAIRFRSRGPV